VKNLLLLITVTIFMFFAVAPLAYAQVNLTEDVCSGTLGNNEKPAICKDIEAGKTTNPLYGKDGILTKAMNVLSIVIGIISVVVMVYAGIQIMLSQGDPAKFNKERNQIIYAAVGLVIAVAARVAVEYAIKKI